MACYPTQQTNGYDESRFEKDVDENFHCSICYNVLKEPRTCRNNEHIFCLACISQHLKVNSETCPECSEHLSVDTLRRLRVMDNMLSKLKINCDYASRGCPEFTCLEGLETHVVNCGYAPVLCSNAECGIEINKQDKVHHETGCCEHRRVTCQDCGQIQEDVRMLKESFRELDEKVETAVNRVVEKYMETIKKMDEEMSEKVEASSRNTAKDFAEMKKEVKDIKDNLCKVNKDVGEVKTMMTHVLEKLNLLGPLNKLSSPTEGMLNTPKQDILVAGGYDGRNGNRSTEIYSWEKNGWFEVSPMNEEHVGASSFFNKGQVFVVGGSRDKTIDNLDINELPLKWKKNPGVLPYACGVHQTAVFQQSVIHIGGYNWDESKRSNLISELQLTSPCAMKELCQMPEPREYHGAEVVEDKVLILGGCVSKKTVDSVLEFDPTTKKCKEMPKLPFALSKIATVRWRDEVVVLGGLDKDNQGRNDVFMYNSKTGKIIALPSMLEKRCACSAVITGNTIVVMGGWNPDYEYLSSVECFPVGSSTWQYLPAMNYARYAAVAEVLPSGRKYV